MQGAQAADLGAAPDATWLREWNLGNVDEYWRPWSADARSRLLAGDPNTPVPAGIVVWAALGPGRLHHTIATGGVISKTETADYTAEHLPAYAALLARAKAWRLGDDTVTFTAADGLASCALIDAVVEHAARLA